MKNLIGKGKILSETISNKGTHWSQGGIVGAEVTASKVCELNGEAEEILGC